ncbi:unnamed protein product [Rotaria sordida]|uniref:phospholipase D n=1 Tax=Rotaria sordida TaxID=392033 RepID=A0A814NC19_9BILA|nr:unnamed protein product [Rotaria sordida]CAF1182744.1 unnamed protein product [Rotaria sordida]
MLIIDQKIAFVGGLDLCFGRWDDEFHRLTDLGKTNDTLSDIVSEIAQERKEIDDELSIETFEQVTEKIVQNADQIQVTTCSSIESIEGQKGSRNEEQSKKSQSMMDTKTRYFIGKDYSNLYKKKMKAVEKYYQDFIDRTVVPRAPWHDGGLVVFGEVARDAARHFIQRWNIHKYEKYLNNKSYPFLLPKTYDNKEELTVENWKEFLNSEPYKIDAQCVRSIGPWSAGTRITEISIQNAYIEMINAAKYFIYIENQYFVTLTNSSKIHNQVGDALYQRVLRAHTSAEKFRVYILLPLLPGYDNANTIRATLYYTMQSITKTEKSLFKRLEAAGKT